MKLFSSIISVLLISLLAVCPAVFADIVVIFDENSASEAGGGDFPAIFTNHDAGSAVEISSTEKYNGKVSVSCTPQQSYNNVVAGWEYSIDDYPYLTFAWKKVGGTGIMIQLAHDTAWAYRYVDGVNTPGWESIVIDENVPEDWTLHTRNLVEDFGDGWNLTGVAFTPWDGDIGYYDCIFLHSEPNETPVEAKEKIAVTWAQIKSK